MLKLHFVTNGIMAISLDGLAFGKHKKDPEDNLKSYFTNAAEVNVAAKDMDEFTEEGIIELTPDSSKKQGVIKVTIDSEHWGRIGTAQIALEKDGQIVFNDNFQSGIKGPIGDPKRQKSYPVIFDVPKASAQEKKTVVPASKKIIPIEEDEG
jgi:hypothetical protein